MAARWTLPIKIENNNSITIFLTTMRFVFYIIVIVVWFPVLVLWLLRSIYSGTCLIWHIKGPGKCVRLYRILEYSGFIIVNRNLWDHKCLSDVTECQKTQVSDYTSSTHQVWNQFEPVCRNVLVPCSDVSTVKTSQHFGKF